MKIKDIIKLGQNFEKSISTNLYLFIERNGQYEFGKLVGESLLIELHEHLASGETDFIETINHNYTCETELKELTYENIKKLATYVI